MCGMFREHLIQLLPVVGVLCLLGCSGDPAQTGVDEPADASTDGTSGDVPNADLPTTDPADTPPLDAADDATEIGPDDLVADALPTDVPDEGTEPEDVPVEDMADVAPPPETVELSEIPLDAAAFDRSVRSGDPGATQIVLGGRYTGDLAVRAIVVETEDGQGKAPVAAAVDAPLNDGGWAHVELDGLSPDTTYHYALVAVESDQTAVARSAIGRFRTAPADDALVPVVFGGSSCSKQIYKPFPMLKHAAQADLSFFITAGDTTYADGANTVDEYRVKWDEALTDEGYVDMMAVTPMIGTWDDHEVENNWDPEKVNQSKLAAATSVYFEQLPARTPNGEQTIWRSIRWGKTVEIFVLDCRSERKPSTILNGKPQQYISPAQMTWLKESLSASDAVFKLIVNSVPITQMPLAFVTVWDRWAGYPQQRDEILKHIADGVKGVVWLSGDFHLAAVTHVGPPGSPYFPQQEILMGPIAHIANPLWLALTGPQFPFASGTLNYTRFTADPTTDPPNLLVEYIDGDGKTFHTEIIEVDSP